LDLGELQVFLMVAKEGSFPAPVSAFIAPSPPSAWLSASWKTPSASLFLSEAPGRFASPMRARF